MAIKMDYLMYKMFQVYIICNIQNNIKKTDIYSDKFLNYLREFVDLNLSTGFINYDNREKIYNLISEIRFNSKYDTYEEKEKRYQIYNDLISKLNLVNPNRYFVFCNDERYKRYFDISDRCYEFSDENIILDYKILIDLCFDLENKEEQTKKILKNYTFDNTFLCSINAILFEQPKILEEMTFRNNLFKILESNLEFCKEFKNGEFSKKDIQLIKFRTLVIYQRIEELIERKIIKKIR